MKIKLSKPLSSRELDALYEKGGNTRAERVYTHIATHSDECDPETIFFALDGQHVPGDRFIPALAARGVCCVGRYALPNCYAVKSGRDALLSLASYYKTTHLASVVHTVGITGSVGKTTTKDAVAIMLSERYRVHKTEKNHNSEIGLPLTILQAPTDSEILVLEMGINHPEEMSRLTRCAIPDVAIITNVGLAHIGNFGSREAIAKEKSRIAISPSVPILADAKEMLLSNLEGLVPVGEGGLYRLLAIESPTPSMLYLSETMQLTLPYPMPTADIHGALLLALSVGERLSLTSEQMKNAAPRILSACGRRHEYQIVGIHVIDDSYNASLESMRLSLSVLSRQRGRTFAVLGDMLELGAYAEAIHEQLGHEIAKFDLSGVYYLGEMVNAVRHGAMACGYDPERIVPLPKGAHKTCTEYILRDLRPGDHLLIKGAHSGELYRIREMLSEQTTK